MKIKSELLAIPDPGNLSPSEMRPKSFLPEQAHPPKQRPYKKIRITIPQNLLFCERFSKKRCASY
jgi:hypothetical protein